MLVAFKFDGVFYVSNLGEGGLGGVGSELLSGTVSNSISQTPLVRT